MVKLNRGRHAYQEGLEGRWHEAARRDRRGAAAAAETGDKRWLSGF